MKSGNDMSNLPGDDFNDEDVTNALKKIRYAFALLDAEHFTLYKDLHMKTKITAFKRSEIDFVDMGTCLLNNEKNEKYYFIKMIHFSQEIRLRQVYILAFSESQILKWDNSLRLQKQPIFVDPALESLTPNLHKKLTPQVDKAIQQLNETYKNYMKQINDAVQQLSQDGGRSQDKSSDSRGGGGDRRAGRDYLSRQLANSTLTWQQKQERD